MKRDDHAGSGPALEHRAGIGADELKMLDPFHPHFGRQDLDDHPRKTFQEGLSDRLLRLCSGTVCTGAWRRRQSVAAKRQVENRKRQLRVVFRQALRLAQKNSRVVEEVETLFVNEWMAPLTSQAEAARDAMGRDVTHVALVHGIPLADATMGRVCQRMGEAGVEFVSLEEAMRDPCNAIAPPLSERRFRNLTQKWCAVTGTPLDNMPPPMLARLESILPTPGMDAATVFESCFTELGAGVGGEPVLSDFLE
jgi:hypothetical protein